jgi:hypothetical protein
MRSFCGFGRKRLKEPRPVADTVFLRFYSENGSREQVKIPITGFLEGRTRGFHPALSVGD